MFVALVCTCSFVLCSQTALEAAMDDKASAVDLSGFPKLTGKLVQLLGHEQGFVRPKPGEPFRLNLADLAHVKQLEFDPKRKSYIPLLGPLAVESVRYYTNGAFANMRLVSGGKGRGRVTVDIEPLAGIGPNQVRVWVVVEYEVVKGVALIEGEAEGKFPSRPK
jgi:hypothetical protein